MIAEEASTGAAIGADVAGVSGVIQRILRIAMAIEASPQQPNAKQVAVDAHAHVHMCRR